MYNHTKVRAQPPSCKFVANRKQAARITWDVGSLGPEAVRTVHGTMEFASAVANVNIDELDCAG
jgi:hypothetical protein